MSVISLYYAGACVLAVSKTRTCAFVAAFSASMYTFFFSLEDASRMKSEKVEDVFASRLNITEHPI